MRTQKGRSCKENCTSLLCISKSKNAASRLYTAIEIRSDYSTCLSSSRKACFLTAGFLLGVFLCVVPDGMVLVSDRHLYKLHQADTTVSPTLREELRHAVVWIEPHEHPRHWQLHERSLNFLRELNWMLSVLSPKLTHRRCVVADT